MFSGVGASPSSLGLDLNIFAGTTVPIRSSLHMADRFVFAPSTFPESRRGTELSWGRRSLYQLLTSLNILVCMFGIESNDFDIKIVSIFIDCHIETARNTHLAHVDLR